MGGTAMPRNGMPAAARRRPETWEERFRYGWRYVRRVGPDGKEVLDEVPLTLEDVLHPQEGDVIPEAPYHEQERGYLSGVFRTRFPDDDSVLVLSDCIVDWGVRGLRNTSPNVSIFRGVRRRPNPRRGTFFLARSGGRCLLALEIVSTDTRDNDVIRKVPEYHQARIPLYVIVDQEEEDGPRTLIGYRWTPQRYVRMRLDKQGRLLLKSLRVRLGLVEDRVQCYDAGTD